MGRAMVEGHQVAMQKNGLALPEGKSDIGLCDTLGTDVACMISKYQGGLLHNKVLSCHRWIRSGLGWVSTPP